MAAHEMHRLFFALWPDEATREALGRAASHLRSLHPESSGRWVRADRFHVTLQFLGGQPDEFPAALARSAARVAASLPSAAAFNLRIDVAGSFRGRAAPWWLGTSRMPAPLRELWRRLRESLRAAGLPHDEREDFTPHVTVLRDARDPLTTSALGDAALDWPVTSFSLMHSRSGAQAPGYDVLETWPLRPAAG